MSTEQTELTIIDTWVNASIDTFNTVDNDLISMATNVSRFNVTHNIHDDLILLGPFGFGLAALNFIMDLLYYYRYRDTWDAYLRREQDRLNKKIYDRLFELTLEKNKDAAQTYQSQLTKIKLLLEEYKSDTEKLKKRFENTDEAALTELKEVEAKINASIVYIDKLGPLQHPRIQPNNAAKETNPPSLELTQAKRYQAKLQNSLESGLARFSDSSWFQVPFAYAWGYWFVFFFTVWGVFGFSAVPLAATVFAFICPLLYLGYKEIAHYKKQRIEARIDLENFQLDSGKTLSLSEEDIKLVLQFKRENTIIETQEQIDAAKKLCAQLPKRLDKNLEIEVDKDVDIGELQEIYTKIQAWKKQQSYTKFFGLHDFRAGWIFLAVLAGLSVNISYWGLAEIAIPLGIGVGIAVLLVGLGISMLFDAMSSQYALKQDDAQKTEIQPSQEANKNNDKKETASSTKAWAFIREQWQKTIMLHLQEIEHGIALDEKKKFTFQAPKTTTPASQVDEHPAKDVFTTVLNFVTGYKKKPNPQLDAQTTTLEKVRGLLVTFLEFGMGYMLGCIIGFVALDFLSHVTLLAPFTDVFAAHFLVGVFSLVTGISSAHRAWLTEQAHLTNLDIKRLDSKDYLQKQSGLDEVRLANANLKNQLKIAILNLKPSDNNPQPLPTEELLRLIEKPTKKSDIKSKARKLLKYVRIALFILTSISSVILISRAFIVMGFAKAVFPNLVSSILIGSLNLNLFAGAINPMGIFILALAGLFLALRVANKLHMAIQKEEELEKIDSIDRRLQEATIEHIQLRNMTKMIGLTPPSAPKYIVNEVARADIGFLVQTTQQEQQHNIDHADYPDSNNFRASNYGLGESHSSSSATMSASHSTTSSPSKKDTPRGTPKGTPTCSPSRTNSYDFDSDDNDESNTSVVGNKTSAARGLKYRPDNTDDDGSDTDERNTASLQHVGKLAVSLKQTRLPSYKNKSRGETAPLPTVFAENKNVDAQQKAAHLSQPPQNQNT